jgi:hypothetical protein
MKTTKAILIFLTVSIVFSSCTVYKSQLLKGEVKSNKTVAILPYNVTLDGGAKMEKNVPKDTIIKMQVDEGLMAQSTIFKLLTAKENYYRVTFQDIQETNKILSKNGILYNEINKKSPSELIDILHVDAILLTSTKREIKGWGTVVFFNGVMRPTFFISSQLYSKASAEKLWEYKELWNIGLIDLKNIPHLYKTVANKEIYLLPYKK